MPKNFDRLFLIALTGLFLSTLLYSFTLAKKRYDNFEYGKFDLGNMSQMVWNTANGRFMEVTDQFGTNMPRWGMSHVDPVLALFAPLYLLYDHPMLLVFLQHVVIISAIFPLYLLVKKKTASPISGLIVALTYVLYPANGFTLVWTGFHGISFVAPLLIWIICLLEETDFLQKGRQLWVFAYWSLIVILLAGKEEVGAILAIASVFLFFKNKRLAIETFAVSTAWFILAFFVIIPSLSNLRQLSIATFVEKTGVTHVDQESAGGDNFFFQRYEYLGSTYPEMLKTVITRPGYVVEKAITDDKIQALNYLAGPLGYVVISSPVWLVSIPDLAIILLSKDEIFDISNHRIAFVVSSLFLSYLYSLFFVYNRLEKFRQARKFLIPIFAIIVLVLNLYFSEKSHNPIFISGKSFVQNKIFARVFAREPENYKVEKFYMIGKTREAKVPRNSVECLSEMAGIIGKMNPQIYSGPDYLGAHAANRPVNALFPARFWDADLFIADLFETKTIGPLGSDGWTFNKEGLRRALETGKYKHLYSCGQISAFVKGSNTDSSVFLDDNTVGDFYTFGTEKIELRVSPVKVESDEIALIMEREYGDFLDKTTFWTFENVGDPDISVSFVDYLSVGSREGIDRASANIQVLQTYVPQFPDDLPPGKYHIFYGVGDLIIAQEIYLGQIDVE